ncbi:hypothetical protein [Trinickia fusca]|uniref:Uncharacterized protein n=1 Tax=Trinickia fusca TaxID=2419777 RepID=A0A494XHN1_9BURK|nr:hypothetical protein [Trinickia fusca]RKP49302.1 hypothetical protein D7S89_11060 [Trinickia fusca]
MAMMNFVTMTQQLHESLRAAVGDRLTSCVPLKELIPIPLVVFPEEEFAKLAGALHLVLSAQQKILRALRATSSQEALLERFCVPRTVWRWVDWDVLDAGEYVIGRVDIVPMPSGGYKFCELNIGPAIEGPQMHGHCESFLRTLGLSTRTFSGGGSPYLDLGRIVRDRCRREERDRVVILDLDSYHTDGPLVYDELKRYFDAQCTECEVHLIKVSEYREEWLRKDEGKRTLVYRLFLEDEMHGQAEWDLLGKIIDSGAALLNTYENYILSSKSWFHLLHDVTYRPLLSKEEVLAIETFVPVTHEINAGNMDALLVDKDRLVFKMSNSTEGKGVLIGSEHSAATLQSALEDRLHEWTAQEFVQAIAPEFPQTHWSRVVAQNAVLGLYHVDGHCSGLLYRCNANKRVVNLASGGKVSWALRVTDEEYRALLRQVAALARAA